jgi:hypothetical protein
MDQIYQKITSYGYKKISNLVFHHVFRDLEIISKKLTKKIFKSIYIFLWEKILKNSMGTTGYILD